jgi:hypothetical protein
MQKLDRLGWAEGLAFSAFGVRVGVRASMSGVLDRVVPLLSPRWKKTRRVMVQRLYSIVVGDDCKRGRTRRLHLLYADSIRLARSMTLDPILEAFEADLHGYTAETSSDMTFLHAGVVGWQGRVILVPGRSFSGKTTLVREMLSLGATYYSDEFAVVDDAGLVHPFARPLGIREQSSRAPTKYTAEKLGASVGVEPLPVGMVVISEYQSGAQWHPIPLSDGQGALGLLANSVAIRSQPRQTLDRLQKLARRAMFVRGMRGEACEAAASILHMSSEHSGGEVA